MNKFSLSLIFLGLFAPVFFVSAEALTGYAWSNNIGWINFGCSDCNVQVTNSAVTGYAWSENYGWINLNPEHGGITNNSGVLSGTAWGQNLGWIYFSGPNNGNTNVNINSQGQFTGTASGDIVGTIAFSDCGASCGVQTDWRLISCGDGICNGSETCNTCSSDCGTCQVTAGGNGMLVSLSSSSVPAGKITILVNDGSPKTNNAAVKVTLNGGSGAAQVELSESSVFLEGIPEVYEPVKSFILSSGNGKKTIYARFFYKDGTISSAISSSIILDTQSPEININQLQDSYNSNEDIIISGTVSEPSEITFYWDNQYGLTNSDSNGRWTVNLGKIQPGINSVSITAKDEVGNSKTITIKIKVIATEVVNPKKTSQTIDDLTKQFWSALSNVASQKIITSKLVTVSKETPEVLKHKWNLLPVKAQK